MSNFIIDCINGDALTADINDYIDKWHESDTDVKLYVFLGMTRNEYELYIEDENYLGIIISAHKNNTNIAYLIRDEMTSMAARSDDAAKTKRLQKWLEKEGLWD